MKRRKKSDGLQILHNRYIKKEPEAIEELKKERENLDIAQEIYDLRLRHGLTQKELSEKIGTTTSVISRLEDADYKGQSLYMLKRIAEALDYRLKLVFEPIKKKNTKEDTIVKRIHR